MEHNGFHNQTLLDNETDLGKNAQVTKKPTRMPVNLQISSD